jgi:starch synthase
MALPLQFALLGSGNAAYADPLRRAAARYPGKLAVHIGYEEALAHRIEAGADMFLMPSRFEPCGLNQLYSLRYGTVPIVRRVGGLADTVVDATPNTLAAGTASGVMFREAQPRALVNAVTRALTLYPDQRRWKKLVVTGMRQDFSWRHSAGEYLTLYDRLVLSRQTT